MYYTGVRVRNASAGFADMLIIPSQLADYVNNGTSTEKMVSEKEAYCFHDELYCGKAHSLCAYEEINNYIKNYVIEWEFKEHESDSELLSISFYLIPANPQKVLSANLKDIEAGGILARKAYAEVPPRVEITLASQQQYANPIAYMSEEGGAAGAGGKRACIKMAESACN